MRPSRGTVRRVVLPLQLLLLAAVAVFWPASGGVADAAVVSVRLASAPTGAMSMTNVARLVRGGANCAQPTSNGVCATLFAEASGDLSPGDAGASNGVTVTYTGGIKTSDFRLYLTNFVPRDAESSALCTAPASAAEANNPASRIEVQVLQGTRVIFPIAGAGFGTLQAFATTYRSATTGLQLRGGRNGSGAPGDWRKNDSSTFTINARLMASASNAYQGCGTGFDFVWFATQ